MNPKNAVRNLLAGCLYFSGIVPLLRWLMRRRRCVVILNYHRASGGHLESHLRYFARHYRVIALEAALAELRASTAPGAPKPHDPRTPLVLTFDDGYADNYTHAATLARAYAMPMTIFLIPEYIDSGSHFWWCAAEHLVGAARVEAAPLDGRAYRLDMPDERRALIVAITRRARCARSVAEREAFLASLRELLQVAEPQPSLASADDRRDRALSWDEVHAMQTEAETISFGAHTLNHPILAYLSDPDEVRREVVECRAALEQRLGRPVRTVAYPVGGAEHIGDEALRAAREAGYVCAVTTMPGHNTALTDPYLLRRMYTDTAYPWWVAATQAVGMWSGLRQALSAHRPLVIGYHTYLNSTPGWRKA